MAAVKGPDLLIHPTVQKGSVISHDADRTRKNCERLAEEIAECTDAVLRDAATRVVRGSETDPEAALRRALLETTAGKTGPMRGALEALAEELAGALNSAAAALASGPAPDEDLDAIVREMPRPDLGEIQVEVRPGILASVSQSWAVRRMQSKMREKAGARIDDALSAYSRLLESWQRKTIAEMQRRFDTQADSYRTQLARMAGAGEAFPADPTAIRRDLELLEAPVGAVSMSRSLQAPSNTQWYSFVYEFRSAAEAPVELIEILEQDRGWAHAVFFDESPLAADPDVLDHRNVAQNPSARVSSLVALVCCADRLLPNVGRRTLHEANAVIGPQFNQRRRVLR